MDESIEGSSVVAQQESAQVSETPGLVGMPKRSLSRLLMVGALAFGSGAAVKETVHYLDEHGPKLALNAAGQLEGSSEVLLKSLDVYDQGKVESHFQEEYGALPALNPELAPINNLIQGAVEKYQAEGMPVTYEQKPDRKQAKYYFDQLADIANDTSISEALKYRGFTRPGHISPAYFPSANVKIERQPVNPIDKLKSKAFGALGKDVDVILLLADRFHDYPSTVEELKKFHHTFSSFYTRPEEAVQKYALEQGIEVDQIPEDMKSQLHEDALRAYMKEIYSTVVPGGLPEKGGKIVDSTDKAHTDDVLVYFLGLHNGDLRLALLDTSLFFKILTRQDLETGKWINEPENMLEAVRLMDRFKDPVSVYGGRFGLSVLDEFNEDTSDLDHYNYGEGSPFNILGETYAVYGAAAALYNYPPDIVAFMFSVHGQAEAGPDSKVQSLDEILSINRQLQHLGEVDQYLRSFTNTGGQSDQGKLNTVRDRLEALSEHHDARSKYHQQMASVRPPRNFSPQLKGKR